MTNNNHVPDVLDTNPFNFVPGVPQPLPVQDTDIRDDAVLEQVLMALDKLGAKNEEVFFCLSQLRFGMYLGKPCYTAAAAQLPLPSNLPAHLPSTWKQGDFDVLIIHRQYGIITCEIKICGYNFQDLQLSQLDIDKQVTRKLKQAAGQLDKAEAVLRHLVSDIAPGLRITKVIVVPHLTSESIQRAITNDFNLKQVREAKMVFRLNAACKDRRWHYISVELQKKIVFKQLIYFLIFSFSCSTEMKCSLMAAYSVYRTWVDALEQSQIL